MATTRKLHWDYRDGRVAAVAAAIAYSLWGLEVAFTGSGPTQGALVDPEATFSQFMESAHRAAAILVVVAAGLGLSLGARRTSRLLTVSWTAMAVFGAAALTTTLFPGSCAISTDVVCAAEARAEGVTGATLPQVFMGVLALVAALTAVVTLALDRRRAGDRSWPTVAALAVLQVVAAVAVLVVAAMIHFASGDGDPGVAPSLTVRLHLLTVALWLLATGLLPGPWRSGRPTPRGVPVRG